MNSKNLPVGFFDSGLGGISVLKKSVEMMPEEDYIYFGDSVNIPYGEKTRDEIIHLTLNSIEYLMQRGVKAIVVACNTATSYAIKNVRALYGDKLPIIGIEPAVKLAVGINTENIILLATNATLKEENFKVKLDQYKSEHRIIQIAAPKLVEFIETGIFGGDEVENYLKNILNDYLHLNDLTVVLGCTHFPFLKSSIKKVLHKDTVFVDGSEGTSRRLKDQLIKYSIKKDSKGIGKIDFLNSLQDDKIIKLCEKLLKLSN